MHALFDQRRYLIPFRSSLLPQIFTDVLIIGTGVGGMRAAIAAAEAGREIIVLSKGPNAAEDSNTAWAQGGIAAVVTQDDSFDAHVQDTLFAGAGLCDEPVVRRVVEGAPDRIRELIRWGMRFDKARAAKDETLPNLNGHPAATSALPHRATDLPGVDGLALGQEGAHSHPRILHADGDATGRELARCLAARLSALPHCRTFTDCFALDLITAGSDPGAPVLGAITFHPRYGLQMIWAKATVLASGGAGVVFRETTNPRSATADGIAMAYRAGATVADLSFIQFHPTTLYLAGRPRSLISEAVRGEGAYLLDQGGRRFMLDEHPMGELAPRDIVSRAIVRRITQHGGTHVFLDVRHLHGFAERFPGIAELLRTCELDPSKDLIPVNPAAHYTIGGVVADADGRTDLPGLFAVGECTCTGLHGANRLASNSLLEGLVLGESTGRAAAAHAAATHTFSHVPIISDIRPSDQGELDLADVLSSLRSAMWRNAGIERSGPRLHDVSDMMDFWARYTLDKIFDAPSGWQTQNLLLTAALIARSAAWRTESRGCHWRADHPESRAELLVHDHWRRGQSSPTLVPVQGGIAAT